MLHWHMVLISTVKKLQKISAELKKEIQEALSGLIKNSERLEFCQLDLMRDDGWDAAV